MVLTLEVIGEHAGKLGAAARKVFDRIGGTIGRLPDNDWVFPDRYVSNRHALIRYVSGKYFIEDTSTNGVFVNSPANRLSRTQGHQLRDGDVIFIDAYQIRVSIAAPQSADRDDPLAMFGRDSTRSLPKRSQREPDADRTASLASAEDIDDIDDIAEVEGPSDEGTQWFGLGEMPEALKQASEAARRPPPASAPSPRAAAPLDDVREHQAAMLAAMRIAFEAMFARFDPERLQEEFDRQMKKGSILGVPGKLRYWDLYREKYGALAGDAEAGFRTLFADEFARAYEAQLEHLRARRAER